MDTVPKPNDLSRKMNWASAPQHTIYQNFDKQYLPISPRNQNVESRMCISERDYDIRKMNGIDNANFVRGNQFSPNYDYKKLYEGIINNVVYPNFKESNPTLVSDSPFYQFPNYDIRFLPNHKSYPYENK